MNWGSRQTLERKEGTSRGPIGDEPALIGAIEESADRLYEDTVSNVRKWLDTQ
jgi:hypothetical protein